MNAGLFGDEYATVGEFLELVTEYREARLKSDTKRRRDSAKAHRDKLLDLGRLSTAKLAKRVAADEKAIRAQERAKRDSVAFPSVWVPSHLPDTEELAADHTYWLTCIARVGFANVMLRLTPRDSQLDAVVQEKMNMWLDNHVALCRYMDSGVKEEEGEPYNDLDVNPVDFSAAWTALGNSVYPDDLPYITYNKRYLEKRPLPDQVLSEVDVILPELLDHAQTVYRQVAFENDEETVQWLIEGTSEQMVMRDRTALLQAQEHRLPFFRCKRFVDKKDVLDHCIWAAMLLNLYTLGRVRSEGKYADKYKDAAYAWQLAHLDLADHCERAGRYDDEYITSVSTSAGVSPLEAFYPYPGRAFHEGDLPNLGPTLHLIAMHGEQNVREFAMAKVLHKSLNFACMRRVLTDTTIKAIQASGAFWKVFCKIMQCMLLGTYAGSRKRPNGDTALCIMRLCADQGEMCDKLRIAEDLSCRVIYTAMREYIVYYGTRNPTYAAACDQVIYWHGLMRDTRRMSELVRETNLRARDTFAEARVLLKNHDKSCDAFVYRYRSGCLSENLFTTVCKNLENNTFCEMENQRHDNVIFDAIVRHIEVDRWKLHQYRALWDRALLTDFNRELLQLDPDGDPETAVATLRAFIAKNEISIERMSSSVVPVQIKENILNMLLHVPEPYRFTEPCFSLLCEPENGGLRREVVHSMVKLVSIYRECGAPKESETQLADFDPYEMRVVTWFFHCCRLYDRIHLVRLDGVTQQRIEHAMKTKRCLLYPGVQELCANDFAVYVTLCCETVVTETSGAYGHDKVRFSLARGLPMCKKGNKKTKAAAAHDHIPLEYPLPAESLDEVAARGRARKLAFIRMSCPQPVLRINLRGYRLVLGSHTDTKKQYQHCPECAAPHRVKTSGFMANGGYRCQNCLAEDKTKVETWKCAYCACNIEPRWNKEAKKWMPPPTNLRVLRIASDPCDPGFDPETNPDIWQELFFCQKHFTSASAITRVRVQDRAAGKEPRYLDKAKLFSRIGASEERNVIRALNIKFAARGIPKDK